MLTDVRKNAPEYQSAHQEHKSHCNSDISHGSGHEVRAAKA